MSVDWGTFLGLARGSVMVVATTCEFAYHSIKRRRKAKKKIVVEKFSIWYC